MHPARLIATAIAALVLGWDAWTTFHHPRPAPVARRALPPESLTRLSSPAVALHEPPARVSEAR